MTDRAPSLERQFMTEMDFIELDKQRAKFDKMLQSDLVIAKKELAKLRGDKLDVKWAYENKIEAIEKFLNTPTRDFNELDMLKWKYNGGLLRSAYEENKVKENHKKQQAYKREQIYRSSDEFFLQKTVYLILMFILIFILPGWLFPLDIPCATPLLEFHVGATITNIIVLCFCSPVQILLFGLACSSDGFHKKKYKYEDDLDIKDVAIGAGVNAAMNARTMSRLGNQLMSDRTRI